MLVRTAHRLTPTPKAGVSTVLFFIYSLEGPQIMTDRVNRAAASGAAARIEAIARYLGIDLAMRSVTDHGRK
jgi:hypothetical protein